MTISLFNEHTAMLRYLGTGQRFYGTSPMRVYRRRHWEFQTVIEGRIAPLLSGETPVPQQRNLWVFPPDRAHGWTGDADHAAEVIVFHLSDVPEQLRTACPENAYLSCQLQAADIARLRWMADQAAENLRHPTALSSLIYQGMQIELSLLALRDRPLQRLPRTEAAARNVVESAIAWWSEQLPSGPTLDDVAKAVFVSPAHLRRLFHRVLQESPRQTLERVRFNRAMQLMEQGQLTFQSVAEACGFGSASAFSRAFKNWHGRSPRDWARAHRPRHQHR